VLAHDDNVMIEALQAFADFLLTLERFRMPFPPAHHRPQDRQVALRGDAGALYELAVSESPWSQSMSGPVQLNPDFRTHVIRFRYESLASPLAVFEYDVASRQRRLCEAVGSSRLRPVALPDRADCRGRPRWHARAHLSAAPKGRPSRRRLSLLLDGYGAYGYANDVEFDPRILSLVDRGIVYGISHVRGGGELGKKWHDGGRMMTKMNTFTDFIASAEYLINAGWADRKRVAISGASAGGCSSERSPTCVPTSGKRSWQMFPSWM